MEKVNAMMLATPERRDVVSAIFLSVVGALIVMLIFAWLWWVRSIVARHRERWRAWNSRTDTPEAQFLSECQISAAAPEARIALAVRGSLGEVGGVPAAKVNAYDSMDDHFWDSIDWLDIIFRTEKAASVKIQNSVWESAAKLAAEERSKVMVRHVVRAVCELAQPWEQAGNRRQRPRAECARRH
jgi:acyl carrier protein